MIPRLVASFARESAGKISHIVLDRAIYSASVLERAISVCSFDPQMTGHCAKLKTNPVVERAVEGPSIEDFCFQSLACEAST